mmetsp:Transcript_828/g.1832  ORF Transcript_828/g.1832 Transcript_828/m.1832 type:complete len:83 (-) Transcript_828:146-394(-)
MTMVHMAEEGTPMTMVNMAEEDIRSQVHKVPMDGVHTAMLTEPSEERQAAAVGHPCSSGNVEARVPRRLFSDRNGARSVALR